MINNTSIKLWFTDFWRPSSIEYIRNFRLYQLLAKYFEITLTPKNPDFLIYSCFGFEFLKYHCIRIFYTGENVRPNLHYCDYSFSFDYPITERNYRLPLYRLDANYEQLFEKRYLDKNILEGRKFCSFLSSNSKAKERQYFFELLSKYKSVDSGGADMNNIGYRVSDKMAWIKDFKFNIAFENSQYPGYTTEKLVQPLAVGTIPIYWGNPIVNQDFNNKAFVNSHDYTSFDDVIEIIKEIDQHDYLYLEYLRQSPFPEGFENEYCREANIINRFNQIFIMNQAFIPKIKKKRHIFRYLISKIKYLKYYRKKRIYLI